MMDMKFVGSSWVVVACEIWYYRLIMHMDYKFHINVSESTFKNLLILQIFDMCDIVHAKKKSTHY
jgi:hypothetical protein